jgi:hypothetical protein
MILYQDGCAIPLGARVFEVANLFLLLRIDTDDGQALVDKSFSLLPDVKELLMAIGVFGRIGKTRLRPVKPSMPLSAISAPTGLRAWPAPGRYVRQLALSLDGVNQSKVAQFLWLRQFQ